MDFFEDVTGFFDAASDAFQQGSELYQQLSGTGTSPVPPSQGHDLVLVAQPAKIPTWVFIVGGAVLIYALARGVRS